jgi:pantoate--beta-alanine ligase
MRQVSSAAVMQRWARRQQARGIRVGLVPTMGYLHAGHLSLVQRARAVVGEGGCVVVSLYVNPLQFGAHEDLSRYPRDLARDRQLCRAAGVDLLFVPSDAEMYPDGDTDGAAPSTYVVEEFLSRQMEGAARPTHFRGVTTVVAKLFNLVLPEVAVFGAKDYQQAALIQRMVRDLNFPVKVLVAPTVREPEGLAMSSRNKYLSPDERQQAVVLWQVLQRARAAVRASTRPWAAVRLRAQLTAMIRRQPAARVDYVEFFDPDSLVPVTRVTIGTHLALAVYIGKTRLIDNMRL